MAECQTLAGSVVVDFDNLHCPVLQFLPRNSKGCIWSRLNTSGWCLTSNCLRHLNYRHSNYEGIFPLPQMSWCVTARRWSGKYSIDDPKFFNNIFGKYFPEMHVYSGKITTEDPIYVIFESIATTITISPITIVNYCERPQIYFCDLLDSNWLVGTVFPIDFE